MTDATQDAFLADIVAAPASDAVRLIYADWLDDRGETDRAEFIRVQCQIAAMDEAGEGVIDPWEGHTCVFDPCPVCVQVDEYTALRVREEGLLAAASVPGGFNTVMPGYISAWTWSRGFVEHVMLSAADFIAHARALRESHPITSVELTTMPEAESSWFGPRLLWRLVGGKVWHGGIRFGDDFYPPTAKMLLDAEFEGIDFRLPNLISPQWASEPSDILADLATIRQNLESGSLVPEPPLYEPLAWRPDYDTV